MAISGRHFQFVQGADKNAPTDCVCSGAHCAAVGGFAALRMRRPLYGERAPCMLAIFAARILRREAFKFVIARPPRGRGALSAKREEVPLGCNLGKAAAFSPMAFL